MRWFEYRPKEPGNVNAYMQLGRALWWRGDLFAIKPFYGIDIGTEGSRLFGNALRETAIRHLRMIKEKRRRGL